MTAAHSSTHEEGSTASKLTDGGKSSLRRTLAETARSTEAGSAAINNMADLNEQATESAKQFLQSGVETLSMQARRASDRLARNLGFSGGDSDRLANQTKQNVEAVARCGTVLTQAVQDASRHWFDLSQRRWEHNLEGLNRLARANSVQELAAAQSEWVREGLQQLVNDSRDIAETNLRAVEEAGKAFPSAGAHRPS